MELKGNVVSKMGRETNDAYPHCTAPHANGPSSAIHFLFLPMPKHDFIYLLFPCPLLCSMINCKQVQYMKRTNKKGIGHTNTKTE